MAIKLDVRYPGRATAANTDYPQGSFKDRSAPGVLDGSYLEKDWANDLIAPFQAAVRDAGITPNGVVDTSVASQYYDAFKKVFKGNLSFSKITTSGNFTTPANITATTLFKITIVAGGGGGGNVTTGVAGGGGAGGAVVFYISGLSPSTSYAVLIGGAGAVGAAGGTTQITINGTVYSCGGGFAGLAGSGQSVNVNSQQGTVSASILALPNLLLKQVDAGAALSVGSDFIGSNGASLPTGGGGMGGHSGAGAGAAGTGYGAGGGGGVASGSPGGAGAPGLLTAEWVA